MPIITPILKYKDSFTVTGLKTRTQNNDEFDAEKARIPGLWQQFYATGIANTDIFSVYSDYASNENGLYTYWVGIMNDTTHLDYNTVTIQAGDYLVFQGFGQMPFTVIETWRHIWDFFATQHPYQRKFITDFEVYKGLNEVAIYIGIQ